MKQKYGDVFSFDTEQKDVSRLYRRSKGGIHHYDVRIFFTLDILFALSKHICTYKLILKGIYHFRKKFIFLIRKL
jgi:hypothetical protein